MEKEVGFKREWVWSLTTTKILYKSHKHLDNFSRLYLDYFPRVADLLHHWIQVRSQGKVVIHLHDPFLIAIDYFIGVGLDMEGKNTLET